MLFSNKERIDQDGSRPGESHFAYLDRSGRPEAAKVRKLLEEWFFQFPENGREELRPRLTTDDDISFLAAFSEIYFHAFLLKIGYNVKIHPELHNGTNKRPDFLAIRGSKPMFFVEVTLATDTSAVDAKAQTRMNVVLDNIDKINSPNLFVYLQFKGAPSTSPPGRKLCNSLESWLRKLDPDIISEVYAKEGWASLPRQSFSHDGWKIDFVAVPKSKKNIGRLEIRPIGVQTFSLQTINSKKSVRNSVAEKANRYGELYLPYVIAINLTKRFANPDTFIDSLMGTAGIPILGNESKENWQADGAWLGPKGPQNKRVSAVWGINALDPWTVSRRETCVYNNPWATHPLSRDLIPCS